MKVESLCDDLIYKNFYFKHLQDAVNFAFYKSGNKDRALDLVQDAFVKVWENCAKVELDKAKSFLFTIVNNLFLNSVKHEKVVVDFAKNHPYKESTNQNPEYLLQEEEFKQQLQKAIADLTAKEREVFLLNRIEGKKYREIADLLNISQKAVEKRMSQALQKIRATIKEL